MTMPLFTTASRTGSTSRPALLAPSPETSITWRADEMLFPWMYSRAAKRAVEMEVRCSPNTGSLARRSAKSWAAFSLSMMVQGMVGIGSKSPAHSMYITAILPRGPESMALITSRWRNAST